MEIRLYVFPSPGYKSVNMHWHLHVTSYPGSWDTHTHVFLFFHRCVCFSLFSLTLSQEYICVTINLGCDIIYLYKNMYSTYKNKQKKTIKRPLKSVPLTEWVFPSWPLPPSYSSCVFGWLCSCTFVFTDLSTFWLGLRYLPPNIHVHIQGRR